MSDQLDVGSVSRMVLSDAAGSLAETQVATVFRTVLADGRPGSELVLGSVSRSVGAVNLESQREVGSVCRYVLVRPADAYVVKDNDLYGVNLLGVVRDGAIQPATSTLLS